MAKLLGAKIGNFHTLTDWGLYLKVGSPEIGAAEPEEYLVQVTGSDSLLNLTTWDDGKVHYKNPVVAAIMSVYWSTVTCIYLCWSFITFDWGITWIIWPIAAIINSLVENLLGDKHGN